MVANDMLERPADNTIVIVIIVVVVIVVIIVEYRFFLYTMYRFLENLSAVRAIARLEAAQNRWIPQIFKIPCRGAAGVEKRVGFKL